MDNFVEKMIKNITKFENLAALIFFACAGIYIYSSYYFFLINKNDYFKQNLDLVSKIGQNLEKNFKEKNLELKFENNTFTTNTPEPIFLENFESSVSTKKNLLYISKNAEDKDFEEKDTFMILGPKDLRIMFGNEPLIYPIESIQQLKTVINLDELSKFNKEFYSSSVLFNNFGFNIILVFKSIEIVFLLFIGNFVLNYISYGILYISGYKDTNSLNLRPKSLIALGIYLIIKNLINVYLFEISFLSVLMVLAVFIAISEKTKLEKN